jgi:hypothetical protein
VVFLDALVFFRVGSLVFLPAGLRLAMTLPLLVAVVRGGGLGTGWLLATKEQSGKSPWLLLLALAAIEAYKLELL